MCFSGSFVVVSLRLVLCSSVEEAWEGSSLGSGWVGCFSVVVVTVHSGMLSDIGLTVFCSTGCSIQGTSAWAKWSGVPGMKKCNFRLIVCFVPCDGGGFCVSCCPICLCVFLIARMSLALRCVMRL